jgi:hypothetical protein
MHFKCLNCAKNSILIGENFSPRSNIESIVTSCSIKECQVDHEIKNIFHSNSIKLPSYYIDDDVIGFQSSLYENMVRCITKKSLFETLYPDDLNLMSNQIQLFINREMGRLKSFPKGLGFISTHESVFDDSTNPVGSYDVWYVQDLKDLTIIFRICADNQCYLQYIG